MSLLMVVLIISTKTVCLSFGSRRPSHLSVHWDRNQFGIWCCPLVKEWSFLTLDTGADDFWLGYETFSYHSVRV